MALNFGDIALAIAEGAGKGAVAVQKDRQERLDKRIKELQKNDVELAKSRHKTAYNEYTKRKESFAPIISAGDNETRNYIYNKEVLKLPEKAALEKAKTESLDISDEWIQSQIGDEPLENYGATDYSSVEAQSILGSLGIGEEGPTVDSQIAAIRSQAKSQQYQAPTPSTPVMSTAAPVERDWMKAEEKDTRGTLLKKYDDAIEIAKRQNIENPEEFAFNLVKADKENKDLRGTTRKKFDDLVGIKIESGTPEKQARAEAMAEVLREEKDNRSAFQKKFDEKVEMYKSIRNLSEEEAKKRALSDIEEENIINRDIVVPTIMAIANGQKVPAAQMAAFQAYNASRQNFFTQAMALGGEGLQQFVAPEGGQPAPAPTPAPTAPLPNGITEDMIQQIINDAKSKGYNVPRDKAIEVAKTRLPK